MGKRVRILRCGFRFKRYAGGVSTPKPASTTGPITVTTSGGVTTVNTDVLLSQPSVKKALQTLGEKAAGVPGPDAPKK
jgi:hypothetical protein